MRYPEAREQTAELLRMVLPLMSKQSAGFHPLSYAVWYEYAAGCNPALNAAVDAMHARKGAPLDNGDIEHLYDQYVALRDIEQSMRMRVKIQDVIEKVSEAATQASVEVTQYNKGLSEYQVRLREDLNREDMAGLVGSLLDATDRVHERTIVIQQDLDDSSVEVQRLREELQIAQGLALTDPLTGLLNRRGFEQYAKGIDGASSGVLFIDIDHFKAINDKHGHLLGDRVIASVAQVLRSSVVGKGQAARVGGEEFAVILSGVNAAVVAETAERVRSMVEKGHFKRLDGAESVGGVTISVGAATCIEGEALTAMMGRADRALYKSKQDGRNRITISTRSDN
jgi:diguanylate cyclase